MIQLFDIDSQSKEPIYRQLINSVNNAIYDKHISLGDQMPSVNEIANHFSLSRDSVFKAFNELRATGVLASVPGKGYFVSSVENTDKLKICLLFDQLNQFKEHIYTAFKETICEAGTIDIYFHHFNPKVLETLLRENVGNYNAFVVMPIIDEKTKDILALIPPKRLYILDLGLEEFGHEYPSVCQNFAKSTYQSLIEAWDLIAKYRKMVLVIPDKIRFIQGIEQQAARFCQEKGLDFVITDQVIGQPLTPETVYLLVEDDMMVEVVEMAHEQNLTIGKQIGILSYNETSFKRVIAGGITTISTDFAYMGRSIAEMILKKEVKHLENPFTLIRRASL
ncbi:GntR family transcriptional regulator [Flectobacillus major]|jgi:DNA-binding transcriptional regulator YhcF (GntR family)|uniref:GntR family transcriptional regulator n=1 Tax=Flectobacillus major TaxID=103 RepID=UPI0003F4B47C|nr:GntR family transcriptional regulator [Flectobacillus major]